AGESLFNWTDHTYRTVSEGTSSDAKLVVASDGKYVLRKLKSELQAISYQHEKNGMIHADLGMWNVIYTHSGCRIIDFEEARYGLEQRTLQYCSRSMQKLTHMTEIVERLYLSR
ncbi:phosphotransferase, partial [Enterobacter quasiroggenkampii]|nr:phosphotransferase [Enterobacter quasiroggenkampii]